jgi:hypothetical protein
MIAYIDDFFLMFVVAHLAPMPAADAAAQTGPGARHVKSISLIAMQRAGGNSSLTVDPTSSGRILAVSSFAPWTATCPANAALSRPMSAPLDRGGPPRLLGSTRVVPHFALAESPDTLTLKPTKQRACQKPAQSLEHNQSRQAIRRAFTANVMCSR